MTPRRVRGLGAGWRPELALWIERRRDLGFVEVVAEHVDAAALPAAIATLRDRGVDIVVHGVALSLGGAQAPDRDRLAHLGAVATAVDAPFVSEHIAFVRAADLETGHLLPLPRTRAALTVLAENIRIAQDQLPVPLVLENTAALFAWPAAELTELDFILELLDRTEVDLLLDVANLWANAHNYGFDPDPWLERLPAERIAYAHAAGGELRGGTYHDTHAHAVPQGVIDLWSAAASTLDVSAVLLERDDRYASPAEWNAELDALEAALPRAERPAVLP